MTVRGTVLVVDDEKQIRALVVAALEDEGYQVIQAVGSAALPLAQVAQPHLILLDIMMPEMDGVEVSRRLGQNPRTAHIPIVAMSAKARGETAQMRADAWLAKPFDLAALYAIVERWIKPALPPHQKRLPGV